MQTPTPLEDSSTSAVRAQLDRSFLAGIMWTGAGKWATQMLSWVTTIVVAHWLTPDDYGIVGGAAVVLGFIQLVSEFGVGSAIVQRRDLTQQQIAQIGGFAVGVGALLMLVSVAIAKPVADFYGNAAIAPVAAALGLSFLITSFRTMPGSLLMRDLAFRTLAIIDAVEALAMTVLTFGLAWAGFGYWALVLGQIASRALGTALVVLARPHRLAAPMPFAPIAAELRFGANVVASRIGWYVYNNADITLVGRLLGTPAMGSYSYMANLASVPVDRIYQLYNRVSGAVIARAQDDLASVRRYLLGITEGASVASFPLAVGMALVTDTFVPVVLGPQWVDAIPVLRVLAIAATLRSLDPILAQVLISTGHPSKNARAMMFGAVAMPVLFFAGSNWGITGVAMAWLIGYPVVVLSQQVVNALGVSRTPLTSYLRALWPAASGCMVMTAVVLAVQWATADLARLPSLVVQIGAGAISYSATLFLAHRDRIRAMRNTIRAARNAPTV